MCARLSLKWMNFARSKQKIGIGSSFTPYLLTASLFLSLLLAYSSSGSRSWDAERFRMLGVRERTSAISGSLYFEIIFRRKNSFYNFEPIIPNFKKYSWITKNYVTLSKSSEKILFEVSFQRIIFMQIRSQKDGTKSRMKFHGIDETPERITLKTATCRSEMDKNGPSQWSFHTNRFEWVQWQMQVWRTVFV